MEDERGEPWSAGRRLAFGADSLQVLSEALALGVEEEKVRASRERNELLTELGALRRRARHAFTDIRAQFVESRETADMLEEEERALLEETREWNLRADKAMRVRKRAVDTGGRGGGIDPDDLTPSQFQKLSSLAAELVTLTEECIELKTEAAHRSQLKTTITVRYREADATLSRLKAAAAVSLQDAQRAFDTAVSEKGKDAEAHRKTLAALTRQVHSQLHAVEHHV